MRQTPQKIFPWTPCSWKAVVRYWRRDATMEILEMQWERKYRQQNNMIFEALNNGNTYLSSMRSISYLSSIYANKQGVALVNLVRIFQWLLPYE